MVNNILLSVYGFVTEKLASLQEEGGQDLVEYAVLVGAIGLVAGAALLFFIDDGTFDTFRDKIASCITFDSFNCNAG